MLKEWFEIELVNLQLILLKVILIYEGVCQCKSVLWFENYVKVVCDGNGYIDIIIDGNELNYMVFFFYILGVYVFIEEFQELIKKICCYVEEMLRCYKNEVGIKDE